MMEKKFNFFILNIIFGRSHPCRSIHHCCRLIRPKTNKNSYGQIVCIYTHTHINFWSCHSGIYIRSIDTKPIKRQHAKMYNVGKSEEQKKKHESNQGTKVMN